ncbi:hypothetical protein [Tomitella biformata]|uniref:hypothetical protein n=1 Tax=Tomitella biformata TaxID=630403 RepID=UPI0004639CA7|nr:hypothetical protein [Tomitella biformata]
MTPQHRGRIARRLRTLPVHTRSQRPALLLGCGLLAGVLLLSGCHNPEVPAAKATSIAQVDGAINPAQVSALSADFDALRSGLDGEVSIAIAPVGHGGEVLSFGDDIEDVAWSTMKVPLSIAALRENGDSVLDLVESAIVYSDNDATWTLWTLLGDDMDTWIDKFDQALRDGGDEVTVFETDRLHSGGPSYGESLWDDADQVRFAAGLPCLADAGPVLEFMGQIDEEQRWGLGTIEGARFKGGWGPGEPDFLTRQFGIIDTPNGQTAVAITAVATSGSLEDGNAMLDEIAKWIVAHLEQLPAGTC